MTNYINYYTNYRAQLTPHPATRLAVIRNAIYFYAITNGPFDNDNRELARRYYNNLREALN